jgi:hypothetical protein
MKKRLDGLEPDESKNGILYYQLRHVWSHLLRQDEGKLDPQQEAAELNKVKRAKLEYEIKVLQQEYMPVVEIERAITEPVMKAKTKLLGLASKLATLVPAISTVEEAEQIIGAQVRETLTELADGGMVYQLDTTAGNKSKRMERPEQDIE